MLLLLCVVISITMCSLASATTVEEKTWGTIKALYRTAEEVEQGPMYRPSAAIGIAWPFGRWDNPNDWVGWQGDSYGGVSGSFCGGHRNHTHSGADLKARDLSRSGCNGVRIYAGFTGKVVQVYKRCENKKSSCNGGYGNTVVIYDVNRHVAIRYSHLSYVAVRKGQRVRRGQYLGKVGKSGNITGPHLHLAAYENIDHFDSQGYPVIPTLCDSEWYCCRVYFYSW